MKYEKLLPFLVKNLKLKSQPTTPFNTVWDYVIELGLSSEPWQLQNENLTNLLQKQELRLVK